MRVRRWLLGCGAVLGLVLTGAAAPAGEAAPVEAKPMLGLPTHGLRAEEIPADKLVFTRQADWTEFWAKHAAGAAPLVDFSRWQVVAVFLGARPNPGYGVDITGCVAAGTSMEVQYTEWKPGPDMVYAQVIVHPYDIVAVPAGGRVSFRAIAEPRERGSATAAESQVLPAPPPSTAVPEQYLLISDEPAWTAFWAQHFPGEVPRVDFSSRVVAGVVASAETPPLRRPHVARIRDRIRVMVAAAGQQAAGSPQLLFVAVPRAPRVDIVMAPHPRRPRRGRGSESRGVEESGRPGSGAPEGESGE
jgi:hypothetical protein